MELEKHVVSLDLALALRENGYPQENALFYWSIPKPENASNEEERLVLANNCEVELCHKWTDWGDKFDRVAAPLASELGEVLPEYIYFQKRGTSWFACYQNSDLDTIPQEIEKTEADSRAAMWLHLRKASLI